MIADTCFIIDLMRENESALKKLAQIEKNNRLQYITVPSVMELAVGVALASLPAREREKIDEILGGFDIVPFDSLSAWKAGIEVGRLRRGGHIVDPIDAQIAGIALQHDESIVTRNLAHFELFKTLRVEPY